MIYFNLAYPIRWSIIVNSAAAFQVQSVFVTNPADPVAAEALSVTWYTLEVTVAAVLVSISRTVRAGWALLIAINDARGNQEQLKLTQMQFTKFLENLLE